MVLHLKKMTTVFVMTAFTNVIFFIVTEQLGNNRVVFPDQPRFLPAVCFFHVFMQIYYVHSCLPLAQEMKQEINHSCLQQHSLVA